MKRSHPRVASPALIRPSRGIQHGLHSTATTENISSYPSASTALPSTIVHSNPQPAEYMTESSDAEYSKQHPHYDSQATYHDLSTVPSSYTDEHDLESFSKGHHKNNCKQKQKVSGNNKRIIGFSWSTITNSHKKKNAGHYDTIAKVDMCLMISLFIIESIIILLSCMLICENVSILSPNFT